MNGQNAGIQAGARLRTRSRKCYGCQQRGWPALEKYERSERQDSWLHSLISPQLGFSSAGGYLWLVGSQACSSRIGAISFGRGNRLYFWRAACARFAGRFVEAAFAADVEALVPSA